MKHIAYVGSNTSSERRGLRVVEIDDADGSLRETACVEDAEFPIYFAVSPDRRLLYAAEKCDSAEGGAEGFAGAVAVYRAGAGGDAPRRIQRIACAPTVPCHVSLVPGRPVLAWAEYRTGHCGTFAIEPDGTLRGPLSNIRHKGATGPNRVRQEAPHCHCAMATPDGSTLFVCDLGLDLVAAYAIESDGTLRRDAARDVRTLPGAGPRHLAFHPNGRWAYLVTELTSTVVPFRLDGGRLVQAGEPLSMLPPDFAGETKAAAIRISPDGTQLAASNRGHDSLAFFALDPSTGCPAPLAVRRLEGSFPRDFLFLPGGRTLLVAHKLSNEFATYAYDPADASLRFLRRSAPMHQPLCFALA